MNTKEVCSKLSVTPKMLKVYESQKLIRAERRDNNYRDYSIDDLLQIQIIVMLRNLGFSLKEIKTVLNLKKSKSDYLYHFYIQLKAVETKIHELNVIKDKLNTAINKVLTDEDKNEELFQGLYHDSKTGSDEITTYEKMISRWNFDQMASDYINRYLKEDKGYLKSISKTAEILLKTVPGKSVLDVGGGTCDLWIDFPENTCLTVMDKSLQMIFAAKDNVPWAVYILDDILLLDIERFRKYDIVVSTFMLHHIPYEHQEKVIKNIIGLCREDGCVIIVDRSFRNESDKRKREKELDEAGNSDFLDIIRSEFYLLSDQVLRYIRYLGYNARTLFFDEEIWSFLIDKRIRDKMKFL
jgi:putative AdoMet-dependent methyltransferase